MATGTAISSVTLTPISESTAERMMTPPIR